MIPVDSSQSDKLLILSPPFIKGSERELERGKDEV
jgi:hypothetical protein